jgi:hypothetical protein
VTGTVGALRAMRMNEKLTNKTYDKAVRLDLPPMALEVVTRNLEDERRHLAAIENHIDRIAADEQYVEVPDSYPPSSPRTPTTEKRSH